ncbi:MAG: ATP-dependent helicase [Thermomicrobiales bacterium]
MSTLPQVSETNDLLVGLNPEQQRAVTTTEGPVLVVAGPGSGKTRVLAHRIAYLIRERGVLADEVLSVTFTNKAASEMRARISNLLGASSVSGLVMGTFHSLGVRILRQNPGIVADRLGLMPSFLIYDDADQMTAAKQAIIAIDLDPKRVAPRRMLSRISAAKSMLFGPDEFANQVETYDDEVVARVYREYQRILSKANAVDFDDLLNLPIRLFDAAPGVLERYQHRFRYILVDEYQDTNRVQYVLVSALAEKHRNLFVVGDPDQSIYAWRQADIRNILDFEQDYPDAQRIHLELNYRSTQRIVATADRVIRENKQRIDRRLRTDNDEGARVMVRLLADQRHEAHFIVAEIRRLMNTTSVTAEGVAVMYRTTAQSRVLEEAFRMNEIPYRIVGGVRFYDRKEVKDVLAVLRLLYNSADEMSLNRVIENMPIGRGLGPKALDAVRAWAALQGRPLLDGFIALIAPVDQTGSPPVLSGAAKASAVRVGEAFAYLRRVQRDLTLTELFDEIVEQTGYKASFDTENEEEMQRWANVLELRSDLEAYGIVAPEEALATYLEQVALIADIDTMDSQDRDKVTLITLHSAKGLEFPVVFISGVEDGLLPISRAIEAEITDSLPLEEERRLFYVGITRAETLLYITYAGTRMLYGRTQSSTPSRFLSALPEDHVSGLDAVTSLTRGNRLSSLQSRVRQEMSSSYSWDERSRSATTAPTPTSTDRSYVQRQRVFHTKFGEGLITKVVDRAGDQELSIEFVRHGKKVILASFGNLDIIDD